MKITLEQIKSNKDVKTYITKADESLKALGYTEHSFAHVGKVSERAAYILKTLGYDERTVELAEIAGYLHDIGNLVNRVDHSQSGAVMAFRLLDKLGMDAEEIATVVTAIGNHDEGTGVAVNPVAAALIIADKCDVRRTRVRNSDYSTFDIHDRVNYSVEKSTVTVSEDKRSIILELEVDTSISAVIDYFQIFIGRMQMSRQAAEAIGLTFSLVINGQKLL
ncbi:MAG: HD domain-containing protein [Clostridia bacterium]|nr:HD domain-containing protein [Clostridia bacterium]